MKALGPGCFQKESFFKESDTDIRLECQSSWVWMAMHPMEERYHEHFLSAGKEPGIVLAAGVLRSTPRGEPTYLRCLFFPTKSRKWGLLHLAYRENSIIKLTDRVYLLGSPHHKYPELFEG